MSILFFFRNQDSGKRRVADSTLLLCCPQAPPADARLTQPFLCFHLATVKGGRESAGPTVIPGTKNADAVKSD